LGSIIKKEGIIKMSRLFQFFGILYLGLAFNSYSDGIKLKDGMTGTVKIIDTTGCNVKFNRNNNTIEITKDKIEFIIKETDTIYYKDYKCTSEAKVLENHELFYPKEAYVEQVKLENKPHFSGPNITPYQFIGAIQILAGVLTEVLVIYDANRTYELNSGTTTFKFKNQWSNNHTCLTILAGTTILSGIITITLK
jgi:hypothetical protein